jgi:hypothetical protein
MISQAQPAAEAAAPRTTGTGVSNLFSSVWHAVATWVETAADYHAAAAMYDALRGLSDAELSRRGLSRATLGRDVCAAYERAER